MSDTEASEDLLGRTYEYCIAQFAEKEGVGGVCRLDGLAYAHNEKPCPVTIDKTLRYEGVHILCRISHCDKE